MVNNNISQTSPIANAAEQLNQLDPTKGQYLVVTKSKDGQYLVGLTRDKKEATSWEKVDKLMSEIMQSKDVKLETKYNMLKRIYKPILTRRSEKMGGIVKFFFGDPLKKLEKELKTLERKIDQERRKPELSEEQRALMIRRGKHAQEVRAGNAPQVEEESTHFSESQLSEEQQALMNKRGVDAKRVRGAEEESKVGQPIPVPAEEEVFDDEGLEQAFMNNALRNRSQETGAQAQQVPQNKKSVPLVTGNTSPQIENLKKSLAATKQALHKEGWKYESPSELRTVLTASSLLRRDKGRIFKLLSKWERQEEELKRIESQIESHLKIGEEPVVEGDIYTSGLVEGEEELISSEKESAQQVPQNKESVPLVTGNTSPQIQERDQLATLNEIKQNLEKNIAETKWSLGQKGWKYESPSELRTALTTSSLLKKDKAPISQRLSKWERQEEELKRIESQIESLSPKHQT